MYLGKRSAQCLAHRESLLSKGPVIRRRRPPRLGLCPWPSPETRESRAHSPSAWAVMGSTAQQLSPPTWLHHSLLFGGGPPVSSAYRGRLTTGAHQTEDSPGNAAARGIPGLPRPQPCWLWRPAIPKFCSMSRVVSAYHVLPASLLLTQPASTPPLQLLSPVPFPPHFRSCCPLQGCSMSGKKQRAPPQQQWCLRNK